MWTQLFSHERRSYEVGLVFEGGVLVEVCHLGEERGQRSLTYCN